eukprot:457809-Rhodomonas_salina.1
MPMHLAPPHWHPMQPWLPPPPATPAQQRHAAKMGLAYAYPHMPPYGYTDAKGRQVSAGGGGMGWRGWRG